ncbi:MAG: prolyl oligopeptidase family serine peptidase [bacterium]|nr:prolyl oligopeptidase family serine peptidase [bacterium]
MKDYFPENYPWTLAISAMGCCGMPASVINDVCAGLKEVAPLGHPQGPERWYQAWTVCGERFARMGRADLEQGRPLSAGRKFMRAAVAHFYANRLISHRDPRNLEAYKKGLDTFKLYLEKSGEQAELIEVPYKDTTLPSVFSRAPGEGRKPCMVHFGGFDSIKEATYITNAETFRRRGISVLYVDHPGVGGALRLRGLAAFPETEVPAGAAVDYLEGRDDVDADRIGMIAQSLGGYYGTRAAAFEKRFKCCIAWGALWDFEELAWKLIKKAGGTGDAPSVTDFTEHLLWVFGKDTVEEAMKVAAGCKLEGVIGKLTVPYLVQHGGNDRQVPLAHARKSVEGAVNSPRAEIKIFSIEEGACEHCNFDDREIANDYMADFAAEVLGGHTKSG